MTQEIRLANGRICLVDDELFDYLNQFSWSQTAFAYAKTRIQGRIVTMHRLLMNAPTGVEVDHINGDGLDNQRSNLRLCSRAENCANIRKMNGCSSRYKGVCWSKQNKKWMAYIKVKGVRTYLGFTDDEAEAGRLYDSAARKAWGRFAKLNFEEPSS